MSGLIHVCGSQTAGISKKRSEKTTVILSAAKNLLGFSN